MKLVLLLPTLMVAMLIMASALCKIVRSALPTIVLVPSLIHCHASLRVAEVHNNVMIHNDNVIIHKAIKQIPAMNVALSIFCSR